MVAIDLATAQEFLNEGAEHVFITGRRQHLLDEIVKKLNNKNLSAIQTDSSNLVDVDKLYNRIKKEKDRMDILFANAGINGIVPLNLVTGKYFDDLFNINVKGVLFLL